MVIDLSILDLEDIVLDEDFTFPNDYKNHDIKKLDQVHISGNIYKDSYDDIKLDLMVCGKMVIEDSISLDDVVYEFSFKIEENLEEDAINDDKTIDITDILWQNILLEIPLRYTKVEDYSDFHGDGWRLISEDEKRGSNNPFKALIENMEEE